MKILYVVNNMAYFLSHRRLLVEAVLKLGHQVTVAGPKGPEVSQIKAIGCRFEPWGMSRRGMNPLTEIKSLLSLRQLLQSEQPDVLHLLTIKPVIYGGLVARWFGRCQVVSTLTGLGYVFTTTERKRQVLRGIIGGLYYLACHYSRHHLIFQNQDDQALFERFGWVKKNQSHLIPGSGIDLQGYPVLPEPKGPICVALPSRMLWDKGVGEFVEAARMLTGKAQFWLVGAPDPGNPASISDTQLEQWQKEGVIEYKGFQQDMLAIYRQVHIICLPSYREGLPRTLLEAGASGRAIVTTEVPGCREIVDPETGLLVPVKDSKALADALLTLIDDEALRHQFTIRMREKIKANYSAEIVNRETIKIYHQSIL